MDVRGLPWTRMLFAFSALGCLCQPLRATVPEKPGIQYVQTIEGVKEYRLANGLQVLLSSDASGSTVTVNVTERVGSRDESYGETGMAHLLEHLNFKGTPSHRDIVSELASHGAVANATTFYDRTNYFETFPASAPNVAWALDLESDRMVHSFLAKKDLDSEMTVVRNEFEMQENDPATVLRERVLETAYLWHNYGHPTIGARSDIEHVPIERLQAFYHRYYRPDNATLIVAGNFDEQQTLVDIEETFGRIEKPASEIPALYTEEPAQDGEREVTLRRAGGTKILRVTYHIPADAHPDSSSLGLLTAILSNEPNGRLYKELVVSKLATSVRAGATGLHDPGFLSIVAILRNDGDLKLVKEKLFQILHGINTEPFTQAELDRVRHEQLNDFDRIMNSPSELASALSESIAAGDWRLLFWDRDQMKKVTLQDLQRVAATYLIDSNATVGIFIPEEKPRRAEIPDAPDLERMFAGYQGGQGVEAGEHLDPSPTALEARTKRSSIGLVKTAFLEKKTRGNRVFGTLAFHFGDEPSLRHKAKIGEFTASLLMRGTQRHSRQELQDRLTEFNATLDVSGAATGVTVNLEAPRDNLEAVLQLAAEMLQEPAFPFADFEEMKRAQLANLEASSADPESRAWRILKRRVSPYAAADFRYVPTFEEESQEISAVTVEDLRDFHRKFYGAAAAEVALVGSFDSRQASEALRLLFVSWKSPTPYHRAVSVYRAVPPRREMDSTPDKANAIYLAGTTLELRDDDAEYPALFVGNEILGGGFMNSRLAIRIRQKDGLSYMVDSGMSADSFDKVGSFTIYAICAPRNVAKVEEDAKEEIERALADGFTSEEIKASKAWILQSKIVGRSTDRGISGELARQLYLGRDFHWQEGLEDKIRTASREEIQKAMQHYIDPAGLVLVEAGDFNEIAH
jgi:zinc protease